MMTSSIPNDPDDIFEYMGNLHIHSIYSDGENTVSEIAATAQKIDLDFIILNDHGHMTDNLHLEDEGFYGELAVILGLEIGERYHHYLAYDLKEMVKSQDSSPQEIIDQVNAQKGFGFLAHPFEKGMPFSGKSIAYTWNDLLVKDFTGICIWNFASRWKERIKTIFHAPFILLFKSQMLKSPSRKTLRFWDDLCRDRRVVAIGGSDAHGAKFRLGPFSFKPLSYDYLLNSINVHIFLNGALPSNFTQAKLDIYNALRQGRLFIAHEMLAPAKGFRFSYFSDDGDALCMGEEGPFKEGVLIIESPQNGEIRLIKNGTLQKRWREQKVSIRVEEKGVYRVEVYHRLFLFGWRPWIFSNPIYLR